MSAEFNWWLLIVGVVAGAALTWLVVSDSTRREREVGERELPAEAAWIARSVGQPGIDADAAEAILRAHRRYLGRSRRDRPGARDHRRRAGAHLAVVGPARSAP
jgi:hypothetical protein